MPLNAPFTTLPTAAELRILIDLGSGATIAATGLGTDDPRLRAHYLGEAPAVAVPHIAAAIGELSLWSVVATGDGVVWGRRADNGSGASDDVLILVELARDGAGSLVNVLSTLRSGTHGFAEQQANIAAVWDALHALPAAPSVGETR